VRHKCVQQSIAASTIVALEATVTRMLGSYRRQVDRIVAPSRFLIDKFVEWGWPREHFVYVPNWLDAAGVEARYSPGDYVLYVGRLSYEKGISTLVRAARAAGVRLAVAGEGPLRAELETLAGPEGTVTFLGFRRGADLARDLAGARAVVVPSECYENAPLAVLEAYAAGKPVLGARIGGIPELIEEDRTGWLFEAGNADDLAMQLARVAAAPETLLGAMGREARARVERDFSRQRYVDAILALYRSLGVRGAGPTPSAPAFMPTDREPWRTPVVP
jgi:glycosyltransferase involved in cell wall biosynthesis